MSPFAGYADFDACVQSNQDAEDPNAYCAAIMHQVEGKSEDGYEFKELPDEAKKLWSDSFKESFGKNDELGASRIAWASVLRRYEKYPNGAWSPMKVFSGVDFKAIMKEDRVIFGAASVSVVDADNELITEEALRTAFKSYVNRGHVLFYHKNIPVGEVVPAYTAKDGSTYTSGVKDGKLNVAVRMYKDTEIANEVWTGIENGQLRSFSIGGKVIGDPVKVCPTDETCYNRIDRIDLHEISIVPNPANEASYFNIIKSKVDAPKKSYAEDRLERLHSLITNEKNKTLNCPTFTEQALKILKGEDSMITDDNTIKQLAERIAKLEAAAKAEHQGDCPEGNHMVDGECVPMEEKSQSKVEGKNMVEEQKKTEPADPPQPVVEAKTEPIPAAAKSELETLRSEIAGLTQAFTAVQSATKEIAGLRDTLVRAPNPVISGSVPSETRTSVTFDPERKPTEFVDWTDKSAGSGVGNFDERLKRIASEMAGPEGKNEESKPETAKDSSQAELGSLRESVLGLAKSIKGTMDEIHALKEKAEVNELKAQITSLAGTMDEYRKEITGLKDTLAIAPPKPVEAQVQADKRTVATEPMNGPLVDVVDWEGAGRAGSFDARMRKLQREYGITQ